MYQILALMLSVIYILSNAAKLPLVTNEKCALRQKFKDMFEEFHRQHNFSVVWDCGLENLAKTEFDAAEAADERFHPTDNQEYYLILTSKGRNLKQALRHVTPLFFNEAEEMKPNTKYGCNTEKRGTVQVFACLYFTYEEELTSDEPVTYQPIRSTTY